LPSAKTIVKKAVVGPVAAAVSTLNSAKRQQDGLLPPISRSAFLDSIPKLRSVLELGPFDVPQIVGPGAAYFDVLNQEELRKRAVQEERDPAGCPVIDYVSECGDLSIVPVPFDAVFSAHVIEHQYDLIQHLVDVYRILKPGGSYYLIIPDKRYCFDHFLKTSSIDDVVEAASGGSAKNVERAIRDSYHNLSHSIPWKHWLGLHGQRIDYRGMDKADCEPAIESFRAGKYRDVHTFHFTPSSFHAILSGLFALGRIPLRPVAVHDTRFGVQEFFAVLERP